MNFDIDPDTTAIAEAVLRFIEREVLPLEARHQAVLGSERTLFQADGRYVPEALALRRQVRMRSAELGYYNLFGDEKLAQLRDSRVALSLVTNRDFGPPQVTTDRGPARSALGHPVQCLFVPP